MIIIPMIANTTTLKGDEVLKCDVTPRAACSVINAISTIIATAIPQVTICLERVLLGSSDNTQAMLAVNTAIDSANFIGFTDGLMPSTIRVSNGATTNIARNRATCAMTTVNSTRLRVKISLITREVSMGAWLSTVDMMTTPF